MLNYLLAAEVVNPNAQVPENLGERLLYGLQISGIGIGMVFLVLIILMAVIYIFKLLFYTIPNRKQSKVAAGTEAVAPVVPVQETDSDDEIAAVIAAVIASYNSSQPQAQARKNYVITSFKRID